MMLNTIKRLTEDNYDEIFSLSQFAFQYELTEEEIVKKRDEASRHSIWGWMDEDKLAAKLHIIPLTSYVNGESFEMGGISSVATWPEYRRQGIIKQLLFHALQEMKANGQTISFLSPFSIPFYRKYGWELAFTHKEYEIPIEHFKCNWKAKGYVRRIEQDIPLLHEIYTICAKEFTGMLTRDDKWWEQRVLTDSSLHIAVAYNEADDAEGYLMYHVKENVYTVKEMAYTSLNGRKLLLQFIANHDSMASKVKMIVPEGDNLSLLLDDPAFDQTVVPYFMARIVDVFSFLKQYPFRKSGQDRELMINVEDAFFPENNGAYKLTEDRTGVDVEKVLNDGTGIHCIVQLLTSMFLGYKRPLELYEADLIRGKVEEIEQLEELIPKQQTFFADFF
jgi:predicted acetyltransferase